MNEIPAGVNVLPEQVAWAVFRLPFVAGIKRALRSGRLDLVVLRLLVPVLRLLHLSGGHFLWARPNIPGEWDVACAYADGFIVTTVVEKVCAKKKFLWIHSDYQQWPQNKMTADAFSRATGAIAVSTNALVSFNKWYKEQQGRPYSKTSRVIYNIIDRDRVLALAVQDGERLSFSSTIKLVTVGRMTFPKGQDLIPQIADTLRKKGLNFEWTLVGGGEMQSQVQSDVDRLGLSDCVLFTGEVANPMGWVKGADIVVQPSRWEGWGITVSEALLLKRPVIVSDIAVFREQVIDGVNGLVVPLDIDALADAIMRLAKDESLRTKMAAYNGDYPFAEDAVCECFNLLLLDVPDI